MSSATSIDRRGLKTPALRPPSDGNVPAGRGLQAPATADDAGFRPWHFFLLASLVTATAAVMMSRRSTPEHLILISLTIIAAGLAAAGFYRMLAPLAAPDMTMFSEPLSDRARLALEREKMLVLRSIKELEFDRAMGKLSPKDFDEMSLRLRTRAIALMKQLDEGDAGYREIIERELRARMAGQADALPASDADKPGKVERPACAACGTANDQDATFCKRCGARV